MEQLELIKKIKTQEEKVQKIIEEARLKASLMIKDAKITKKEAILKASSEEALREAQKIKGQFKLQAQEAIKKIEKEKNEHIEKIKNLASKNKNKTIDYIVDEVLKLWQLQR